MYFLLYTRYSLKYLTLNKIHQVIQTHLFMLELLFRIYCLCTVVLYFSTVNNKTSFEEQNVYLSFLDLIFEESSEQFCVFHLFYCFMWLWISFPYLYLDSYWLFLFFILCPAKKITKFYGRINFVLQTVANIFR